MKLLTKTVVLLIVSLAGLSAEAANLEIGGAVSYQTVDNQQNVRIKADSIVNRSTNATSGTVHLRLFATPSPDLFQNGYLLADINFANYANDSGRLGPGQGFSNIDITVPFNRPPDGTWYIHLYVSEFPDISTVDDYRTFSGTATWGNNNNGGGGGGNDDHSDFFQAASTISLNSSQPGVLETAGDIDVFRISVPSSGELLVSTSGGTDTIGTLYNSAQSGIASDDDSGEGLNFGFASQVSAGTYYVAVAGFDGLATGGYSLNVSFSPDGNSDPFDDFDNTGGGGGGGGGSLDPLALLLLLPIVVAFRRSRA